MRAVEGRLYSWEEVVVAFLGFLACEAFASNGDQNR